MSRTKWGSYLVFLSLVIAPTLAAAQSDPTPDQFIVQTTGRGDLLIGSLDWAILSANAGSNSANSILFESSELDNFSIVLSDSELPAIDLQPGDPTAGRHVDLIASNTRDFRIYTDEEVSDTFLLLHVKSGQATLVDLDISGKTFQIDSDAILGFRYAADLTFSDSISGAGRLVKEGDARLRLTGANDYTGGTEVRSGELSGNRNSIVGDFDVAKHATLSFEDEDVSHFHLFKNLVSGEGKVVKTGTHLLQIAGPGALENTGGIEILGGEGSRLLGDTDTIYGDVIVGRGASFELSQVTLNVAGDYDGNISGEGKLVKSGSQPLQLKGENSFTGGLFISTGSVSGNHSSIPGDITLESKEAEVIFDQAGGDGSHNGIIAGLGSLKKEGAHALTLVGSSSYEDGTFVNDGILRGDVDSLKGEIEVASGAILDFDLSGVQRFSGEVKGSGDLLKSGTGTLIFESAQSYTGATRVDAGTLRLESDLIHTSSVEVGVGSSLENGFSTLQVGGSFENHGRLFAGAETDEVHFLGNAQFNSTSSLAVTVDDQQNSSRIVVDGNAFIDEANIELTVLPGLYPTAAEGGLQYVVFSAAEICPPAPAICDAAAVSFGSVTSDSAFLDIDAPLIESALGGGQQVVIAIAKNTSNSSDFAETPNQLAAATAFDELLAAGSADSLEIEKSWSVLSSEQVPESLDRIGGDSLSAFESARVANAENFLRSLSRRFSANDYETGSVAADASNLARQFKASRRVADFEQPESEPAGRRGNWLEVFGLFGNRKAGLETSRIQARAYGFSAGIDGRLPENWPGSGSENVRVGVGVGYTRHALEDNHGMRGDGNSFQTALYGSWQHRGLHIGLAGRYGYTEFETSRRMAFGTIDRRAVGQTSGHEAGGLVEIGFLLGEPTRLALRPLARFEFNRIRRGEIVESGAGDLSLRAAANNFDSMTSDLGARLSKLYTLRGEFGIEAEIRGGWRREFGDRERPVEVRFHNVETATPFVTRGVAMDANSFHVGTGYIMSISRVPLVGLNYDATIGDSHTRHVISAELYLRW